MLSPINIKFVLAITVSLIEIIGAFLPYLRDIFLKKTKPHAYTWLIWTITQGTAVAGLWYGKGGWGALALIIGTMFVFLIFLLSLKYGTRNITSGDKAVLIAALLAIVIWWQLHRPLLAVLMVCVIDILGFLPSFRKTFEQPWTETITTWAVFSLVDILNMFALRKYNFFTLAYLIVITTANITLFAICLLRRRVVPSPT